MPSRVIPNDFVSRYELVKHLVGVHDGWRLPFGHTVEDEIINFPAADVAPVRHGRWIDMGDFISCSLCNATRMKEFLCDYDVARRLDVRTNYCPNCGAKMDGAIEESAD
jgi:hypothetical protein